MVEVQTKISKIVIVCFVYSLSSKKKLFGVVYINKKNLLCILQTNLKCTFNQSIGVQLHLKCLNTDMQVMPVLGTKTMV